LCPHISIKRKARRTAQNLVVENPRNMSHLTDSLCKEYRLDNDFVIQFLFQKRSVRLRYFDEHSEEESVMARDFSHRSKARPLSAVFCGAVHHARLIWK
jgi:uncharacterized 2Fe-2S/4Fe-4S cluster protein (DUF4445 family)